MQGKLNKNIGFSLIIFAFFFLFDPNYALIDAFPDFIGYIILCLALINLADINDKIGVAFKGFRNAIALSVLRFVALIALEKVFGEDEQSTGLLLFVFVFAILELVVLIPAYRALFEGLLSLGIFEDGNAVYYKKGGKGKNATEKAYLFTAVFLVIKNALCVLPELTSLQTSQGYEFVGIMRILAMIALVPISILWLVHMIAYFKRIEKDKPFIDALSEKYLSRVAQTPEFFKCRALSVGLYSALVAFIFAFDFFVENVNVIPDFLFYGAIILLVVFLRKEITKRVRIMIPALLGTLSSVAVFLLEKDFFNLYAIEAVIKNFEAYNLYNLLVCLYAVKAVLFIITSYFAIREIGGVYSKHIAPLHKDNQSYLSEHEKNVRCRSIICCVLGLLSAASTLYRVLSLPYHDISWVYYYSGVITSVVQITFFASVAVFITYLVAEVRYNYKSSL